jgi:surface antigen
MSWRATVAGHIHNAAPGSTAAWSNPASGNSGTVRLLDVFHRQGRRCEHIEYRNIPAEKARPTERLVMTSCLQPDGSWKLSTAGR